MTEFWVRLDEDRTRPCVPPPGGCFGSISWRRLVEIARAGREFRPDERVTHLRIDSDGIMYRVETRPSSSGGDL